MLSLQMIFIMCISSTISFVQERKMVIVVNVRAQMSSGKIAAQVAHGAVALTLKCQKKPRQEENLQIWLKQGMTKVILRAEGEERLEALQLKARKLKLPTVIIHDAGRTEVQSGTATVLAILGEEHEVDRVTANLPLLK